MQPIAAGDYNTRFFPRTDLNWTDFIEVDVRDIGKMKERLTKGFTENDLGGYSLQGRYRNGTFTPPGWSAPCPLDGGKEQGIPTNSPDTHYYFYKGFGEADCIQFLYELGLVT